MNGARESFTGSALSDFGLDLVQYGPEPRDVTVPTDLNNVFPRQIGDVGEDDRERISLSPPAASS